MTVRDVAVAAATASAAAVAVRMAAVEAVRGGAQVTDVAKAAGVARVTIYRWLGEITPALPLL